MENSNDKYLDFAIDLSKQAADILMQNYGKQHVQTVKESFHSIVTQSDLDVEDFIVKSIKSMFPDHGILSEEQTTYNIQSDYVWVIDPLDGSSYYSRSLPNFSVAIALVHQDALQLGVVNCPAIEKLFFAQLGKGAFCNQLPIAVSDIADFSKSMVNFGHRFLRETQVYPMSHKLLNSVRSIRAGGSCAQELSLLSAGHVEAVITVNQQCWDFFAAWVILEEAGGKITNLRNEKIDIRIAMSSTTDILAHNGKLNFYSFL
jgi:myo-inositol-1(or 4)-monophosphatase